jgi:hypothetical protein
VVLYRDTRTNVYRVSTAKNYSRTPIIRKLVIRISNYPDRLGPSGKFVENSTKLTCLEITGYRNKCSTVLLLLELQIRRGPKVYTQVHTVNSNSRTSNCQCYLLSNKNPIIRIFCPSGWPAVPINLAKCSSTVSENPYHFPRFWHWPALHIDMKRHVNGQFSTSLTMLWKWRNRIRPMKKEDDHEWFKALFPKLFCSRAPFGLEK